jgi:hypothetical protein
MTTALRKLALAAALAAIGTAQASIADHHEFEATLHAPYRAAAGANEARNFTLEFSFPQLQAAQSVSWVLEVVAPNGSVVERWSGVERLFDKAVTVNVEWAGRNRRNALPNGIYKARLRAIAEDAQRGLSSGADAVLRRIAGHDGEVHEQEWEIAIGQQAQAKAAAPTMMSAAAAPSSLPYTVYFGNMHSQTNHSDGGGNLAACTGAQAPQSAAYGPTDAFSYAKARGLDFLMASEHNHMYDGSDATNTSANPATAKALYQSGLAEAASFNSTNPNFLAIYGMEWGVINNGGHMNILNSNELLGWESNSSGQLLADTLTAKNDYAGLYTAGAVQPSIEFRPVPGQFRPAWLYRRRRRSDGAVRSDEHFRLLDQHHRNRDRPQQLRRRLPQGPGSRLPRGIQHRPGQPLRELGRFVHQPHRRADPERHGADDRQLHGRDPRPPCLCDHGQDFAAGAHRQRPYDGRALYQ